MSSNPPISSMLPSGWHVEYHPLSLHHRDDTTAGFERQEGGTTHETCTINEKEAMIILVSMPLADLFRHHGDAYRAFVPHIIEEGDDDEDNYSSSDGIKARAASWVALADYASRSLGDILPINSDVYAIQTMGQSRHYNAASNNNAAGNGRRMRRKMARRREMPIPYVLERTDCVVKGDDCCGATLQFFLHTTSSLHDNNGNNTTTRQMLLEGMISPILDRLKRRLTSSDCYAHVACVVLQRRLRAMLQPPKQLAVEEDAEVTGDGSDDNNSDEKKAEMDNDNTNSKDGHQHQQQCLNAVAFIADGSLLPRKSGRSTAPMSSPPAVPFSSPGGSEQLTRVVTVEVGEFWRRYLNEDGSVAAEAASSSSGDDEKTTLMDATTTTTIDAAYTCPPPTTVTMRGMIIPRGVTLIVGGGYHGKSTLLQALCMGVYDKVPRDGRERAVTHSDAVSIRAEDGRYVNNCNVSAFISNLPSGESVNGASISSNRDTTRFSTRDASGSTSQAANVIEALECGASALLVDEDVSAANFMARDGRMRAMIMDEPITPLLYRVNGLFLSKQHQVSTVVVVGGVGEWLDVADAVVLMKDYVAFDGLKKARSVSYQFSYGHVQYAGRGVVHRLPWKVEREYKREMFTEGDGDERSGGTESDKKPTSATLSPLRRRPSSECTTRKFQGAAVHLLESGSSRLWFYRDDEADADSNGATTRLVGSSSDDSDGEDDGVLDMSKCSQLVGNTSEQLYGCGLCVLWLIRESQRHPEEDISDLLDRMEHLLIRSNGGMIELMASLTQSQATAIAADNGNQVVLDLWETVGLAYRPRRHEVAMALTRMRGMRFDILPEKPNVMEAKLSEEEAKRIEEDSRKTALAELWKNRRKR